MLFAKFRVGLSKQKEMYTSSKVVFSLVLLTLGLIAVVSCVGNEHGRRNDYEGERGESAESPHFIHKINNHLIYTLAKPPKKKKQSNNEEVEEVGNPPLKEVIRKMLDMSGLKGVFLNERVFSNIRNQINRVLPAALKATKAGGKSFKRLKDKWMSGEKSYSFKVFFNEVDVLQLREENKMLLNQKREAEADLLRERTKRQKLELSQKSWKTKFRNAIKKLKALKNKKKVRGKEINKSFSDYSVKQKQRIKMMIKNECATTLNILGLYDLVPTKVEVFNMNENKYEVISLLDDDEFVKNADIIEDDNLNRTLTDSELDDISLMLYVKDKFHIPDQAWQELSQLSNDIQSLYSLKNRLKLLNSKWNIFPTPGDTEGVQMRLADSLKEQIEKLLDKGEILSDKIQIKVSGDGTRVGKRLQLLNVTYTIIDEGDSAMSDKGNYVIAIIKTKDDYEGIRVSLQDLRTEMKELTSVNVKGKTYHLEYFLGGNWKFLATVCGIGPANHEFACIWCKCPRSERWNPNKHWSISDVAKGARTLGEIKELSRLSQKKYNCQRAPLFDFIPLDHVIIDTLHLFLRISDVLIELLIKELRTQDAILKKEVFNAGFQREKYTSVAKYECFLNSIGISFHWEINRDTKKLSYRDLTGPEKLLLFQKIDIIDLLPKTNEKLKIKVIWEHFISLIDKLKLSYDSEDELEAFQMDIKNWIKKFNEVYQTKDVTPYMHALHVHVPEFLQIHKNIALFNQQGLEKYNDQCSKDYFRSSNHRGVESLKQLLLKRNRLQLLEAMGAERVKARYKCRNCSLVGHTIKKCVAACSHCAAQTCCAHLVKVDGKWKKQCQI